MGLALRCPLVASASPLTGTLDGLRALEAAGVGAVVLPSLFQEEIEAEQARYDRLAEAGAESFPEATTFMPTHAIRFEGVERHLDLIRDARRTLGIPVIASLNGTTESGWTRYAAEMQAAGAQALELNIYLLATDAAAGAIAEQRHLDIIRAVRARVGIPLAVKLHPYFSAFGAFAQAAQREGADALVLFNRLYQPDIDLLRLAWVADLDLSRRNEIRLPLLWTSLLSGRIGASLAASTGVEGAEEVVKYLLAGADVVMTSSALLRHGPGHAAILVQGLRHWMQAQGFDRPAQFRGRLSHAEISRPEAASRADYIEILRSVGAEPRPVAAGT